MSVNLLARAVWPPYCATSLSCAYAPTRTTASHDNHEKIDSCTLFSFLYGYGALSGFSGRWSSAITSLDGHSELSYC